MSRRGFTLIELVVVLGMIAVLVGIAASRADVQRVRVDTSAKTVALVMDAAQRKAALRQHDMIIAFDASEARIRVHTDADNDGAIGTGEDVRWVTVEEDVRFGRSASEFAPFGTADIQFSNQQNGLPAVTFHRNGSTSEYGGFYLTSASGSVEYDRAVEVLRASGEIRCYSYRTGSWEVGC